MSLSGLNVSTWRGLVNLHNRLNLEGTNAMPDATQHAQPAPAPAPGPDILDRLLGQPHTTSEPPEVTAQREALMADVATEIRHLRQIVGLQDNVKTLAKSVKAALDAYEAAEKAAEEKAAADAKAAEKAAADTKAAEAAHAQQAAHAPAQHAPQAAHKAQ